MAKTLKEIYDFINTRKITGLYETVSSDIDEVKPQNIKQQGDCKIISEFLGSFYIHKQKYQKLFEEAQANLISRHTRKNYQAFLENKYRIWITDVLIENYKKFGESFEKYEYETSILIGETNYGQEKYKIYAGLIPTDHNYYGSFEFGVLLSLREIDKLKSYNLSDYNFSDYSLVWKNGITLGDIDCIDGNGASFKQAIENAFGKENFWEFFESETERIISWYLDFRKQYRFRTFEEINGNKIEIELFRKKK